ncbi:MAG: retroviral-like aspartic protease family protein [Spirochaetales bacterium]|jgi:clan AA aspartic protease|nr:retroviral-like aspartic protease family protein [Spirochaetales bacterium]
MGTVYAEITLKNAGDIAGVQRGYITEKEVRATTVQALVDTGCGTLVITDEVRKALGLEIVGLRGSTLANGARQVCQVTEPVQIHWKNRDTACRAIVLPGAEEVLLGAIPLEDMDLIINPARKELTGAHGDEVICLIK